MSRIGWMASGVLVWALHFAALYGFTALACARGYGGAVPWFAGFAAVAALAVLLVIVVRNLPRHAEFEGWMSVSIAGLALIAMAYETASVYLVRPCA